MFDRFPIGARDGKNLGRDRSRPRLVFVKPSDSGTTCPAPRRVL